MLTIVDYEDAHAMGYVGFSDMYMYELGDFVAFCLGRRGLVVFGIGFRCNDPWCVRLLRLLVVPWLG